MSTRSLAALTALSLMLAAPSAFAKQLLRPMLQKAVVQDGLTVKQARQVFRSVLRRAPGAEAALVRHTYAQHKRLEHTGKSRVVALGRSGASALWAIATVVSTGIAWNTAPFLLIATQLGAVPTVAQGVGAAKAWREHTKNMDRAMVGAMGQLLRPEQSAQLSMDTQRALSAALKRITR